MAVIWPSSAAVCPRWTRSRGSGSGDGDIWAINGTWRWCRDNGIAATFFSIDPQEDQVELVQGVNKAVLAAHTEPKVWDVLKDADVSVFRYPVPGPTSAVAASLVALTAGYRTVTYFGCEGSFGATTHTFKDEMHDTVEVFCGGWFTTKLEFILQAEQISSLLKRFPEYFSEESGGLLAAMVEHDWDIPSEGGGGCPFPRLWRSLRVNA